MHLADRVGRPRPPVAVASVWFVFPVWAFLRFVFTRVPILAHRGDFDES